MTDNQTFRQQYSSYHDLDVTRSEMNCSCSWTSASLRVVSDPLKHSVHDDQFPLNLTPDYSVTSSSMTVWYTGCRCVRCYIWYSRGD